MMASYNCCYEPIELRRLKAKLAAVTCDCASCDRKNCLVLPDVQLDQQVQVGEPRRITNSLDRFTQVTSATITRDQTALINTLTKEILCPSCFITMNLLRGGALKVLKDQESETIHEMFTCDKCTGKHIRAVERCTSCMEPKWRSNNVSVYDDNLSDATFSDSSLCRPERPPHNPHQVKFIDVETEAISHKNQGCVCLDEFIESIRPPMRECVFSRRQQ